MLIRQFALGLLHDELQNESNVRSDQSQLAKVFAQAVYSPSPHQRLCTRPTFYTEGKGLSHSDGFYDHCKSANLCVPETRRQIQKAALWLYVLLSNLLDSSPPHRVPGEDVQESRRRMARDLSFCFGKFCPRSPVQALPRTRGGRDRPLGGRSASTWGCATRGSRGLRHGLGRDATTDRIKTRTPIENSHREEFTSGAAAAAGGSSRSTRRRRGRR